MRRNFRLDFQIVRGAPGGEVGHERTRFVIFIEGNRPLFIGDEYLPDIRGNGTGRHLFAGAEGGADLTGGVVIDDTAHRAVVERVFLLVFKGNVAAADHCDAVPLGEFRLYALYRIVLSFPVTGNDDVVESFFLGAL